MSEWGRVDCGFASADETVNFGTRAFARGDSIIYEASTVATIHATSSRNDHLLPVTRSQTCKNGVAVAIDKTFMFFNPEFDSVAVLVNFESPINATVETNDGTSVCLSLVDGSIIRVDLESKKTVLFSAECLPEEARSSHVIKFVTDCDNALYSIHKNGCIVNLKKLLDSVEFGSSDFLQVDKQSFTDGFQIEQTPDDILGPLVSASDLMIREPDGSLLCVYFCDKDYLYCWSKGKMLKCASLSMVGEIVKIEATSDARHIICLTVDGELLLMCQKTLTFLTIITNEEVIDFTLTATSVGESLDRAVTFSIVYYTKSLHINMFDLQSLTSKFKLKVGENALLIDQPTNYEGVLFFESPKNKTIDKLLLKVIDQVCPEERLQRLCQRGKFREAREFALTFKLDQEYVLKSEVQSLMGTLPLLNRFDEHDINASFSTLMSTLENIKDLKFVAEVCMKTVPPDVSKTQQLIDYALSRFRGLDENQRAALVPVVDQIRSLHVTFVTFLRVSGDEPTPDEWLSFSSRNPLLIYKNFISQGKMDEASIVCRRHQHRIKKELSLEMTTSILQSVPARISLDSAIDFVNTFVPILMRAQPKALTNVINFIKSKALMLEKQEPRTWLEKAINFTESAIDIMCNNIQSKNYGPEMIPMLTSMNLPTYPINQLETFLRHLKAIASLRHDHNIEINYDAYCSGLDNEVSAKELLLRLFDLVPVRGVEKFVTQFVPSFSANLYKEISSVISSYVLDSIACSTRRSRYLYYHGGHREARHIAFTNCITKLEDKLKTIMCVVDFADVPWSDQMAQLVESALSIKHPMVISLEEVTNRLPQKLILKKYGFSLSVDTSDIRVILKRIFETGGDLTALLEDAKQLVVPNSEDALDPYIILLYHSMKTSGMDEALDIVQSQLGQEEILSVTESFLSIVNSELKIMERMEQKKEFQEKILPAISKLSRFPEDHLPSRGSVRHIKAVCTLNDDYGTNYRWNDLFRSGPLGILDECTKNLVDREEDKDTLLVKATNTARLLSEPEDLGLVELADVCLQRSKADIALVALRRVSDNDRIYETHGDRISKLLITAIVNLFNSCNIPDKQLLNVLCTVAVQNMAQAEDHSLPFYNNFLRLCKIFSVSNVKPTWSSCYIDPLDSPFFQLTDSIYNSLLTSFKVLRNEENQENGVQLQDELLRTCQSLPKDLISLSRIHELTLLLVKENLIERTNLKEIKLATSLICKNVIMNIFSNNSRKTDLRLSLAMLSNFAPDQILQWLHYLAKHKRDMKFSKNMSTAVKFYCQEHQAVIGRNHEFNLIAQYFIQLDKVSSWSLKAYRHGIPYREALADTVEEQLRFLNRLITVNDITLNDLEKYCRDMGLDVQECYTVYVKHALLSWTPVYKTFKTSSGRREIIFEENTVTLGIKCQSVMKKIVNPQDFVKTLMKKDFWEQINTYYYEVYLTIFEMASTLWPGKVSQYMFALRFLKAYTRIGAIQEEESTDWLTSNPGSSSVPEIAYYRLPYRSIPFSILLIQPEISLDTYTKWRCAPPMILDPKIDRDCICSLAISNLKKTEQPETSGWNFHHKKGELLEKIMQCVDQMSNIETAVASLYFVVNYVMPPGVDQVQAAQQCYLKAETWRREDRSEVANNKFVKAEKKYFTVSTQHILHSCGLGKPDYLSMATEPTRLIMELYSDPSIIQSNVINMPSINEAVERIIALHELDRVKITLELLNQWLQPEAALQATMNESMLNVSEESDEEHIKRACYLLVGNKHFDEIERYLVGQAFPRNLEIKTKSPGVSSRAIRILMNTHTAEHLEQITARDFNSIKDYLQVVDILGELEKFGVVYSVAGFELSNKKDIVANLLQYKHCSSVRLAWRISRCYSIADVQYTTRILSMMRALEMVSDLAEALLEIPASQADEDVMKSCWNKVIMAAMLRAERGEGSFDDLEVKNVVNILHSCPDLSFLDLPSVYAFFKKINNPDMVKFLEYFVRP
ncbi:Rough deal protein C-terminal region [Nesidiocoris tenuis]|uniref:Rough deal protein C-terminal region n=1 Tax=Nesidiocoris tenuis TaxID=355587 RepID=A0ABN7AXE8_9HEMI|nr:Rough deal protein C-terminal region [Nesidiocoris tenuis]